MVKLTFKDQIDDFVNRGERLEDPFFTQIEPMSSPIFIPGHLYVFSARRISDSEIPTPSELLSTKEAQKYTLTRPYYDTLPIGVCLSDSSSAVTILNTKIMPIGATQVILNVLWQTLNNTIKKSYTDGGKFISDARDLFKIPEYSQLLGFNQDPFAMASLISKATGGKFNVNYAVNKYQKEDIANPRLIPFHLVPRIAQTNIFSGIQTRALDMDSVISPFIKQ